ncbi:MAG: hypothetical protein DRP80_05920 [Candidatus Omnitrophota bacterium]|nr:MAG: hypothetical protein DRP69_05240 [Candidatus Omnitrophota bacterium]RKY43183.1 MAG: hypothetical protein DRP80_05920 [Candidatus Omnitrophota bacterium]
MRGRKKSSLLVIILFILFFLSVFSLSLSYSLRLKIDLFKRYLQRFNSLYITRGIINFVIAKLEKISQQKDYDFLEEEDFLKFKGKKILNFYDFKKEPIKNYQIYVFDEEARLNINTVSLETLKRLLKHFPRWSSQKLADKILGYRESKKNKLLYSLKELLFIPELKKDYFYGEDLNESTSLEEDEDLNQNGKLDLGIKDFLTIYGEGKVNINNAGLEVLESIEGLSLDKAKEIVEKRPFKSLEEVKEKLSLSDEEFQRLNPKIKVESNYFRVVVIFEDREGSFRVNRAIVKRDSSQVIYFQPF